MLALPLQDVTEQSKSAFCQFEMATKTACGRRIHHAPPGIDREPVCLMHSHDPAKLSISELRDAFFEELEWVLEYGHKRPVLNRDGLWTRTSDLTGFVFPDLDLRNRTFYQVCMFGKTHFLGGASFVNTSFFSNANFFFAEFHGEADFTDATFVNVEFREAAFNLAKFRGDAFFNKCTFERVDFYMAEFSKHAFFVDTKFCEDADFRETKFTGEAVFSGAIFKKKVDFGFSEMRAVKFGKEKLREVRGFEQSQFVELLPVRFDDSPDFTHVSFGQDTSFNKVIFPEGTLFTGATFERARMFFEATFEKHGNFRGTVFTSLADFSGVVFPKHVDFSEAVFDYDVVFDNSVFRNTSTFDKAIFKQNALFIDTEFHGTVWMTDCRFEKGARFHRAIFRAGDEHADVHVLDPSIVFSGTVFLNPNEIVFDDISLDRALFLKCDVSKIVFMHSVVWRPRRAGRGIRLFEELVALENQSASALRSKIGRDYRLIAQVYRQLKKNYDDRSDYWTANDFHLGEMEMQRLVPSTNGAYKAQREWLHRYTGVVAWYGYTCDYGNAFVRPFIWLLAVVFIFAALYPLFGIRGTTQSCVETYQSAWIYGSVSSHPWIEEFVLFGESLLASVDIATFQKTPSFTPASAFGHALSVVEVLLTSTLFALFALSLRRGFRR